MPDTPTADTGRPWDHKPICAGCGKEGAYNDSNGVVASGYYGSRRHDATAMIWLVDREKKQEDLCDDCIDQHIEAGHLEAFSSGFSELPEGTPSETAYRKLFAWGAQRIVGAFLEENDGRPLQTRDFDEAAIERIRRLRNKSTGEDNGRVVRLTDKVERAKLCRRAIDVGEIHAFAAISLGHIEGDPGFEQAAAVWAEERIAADKLIAWSLNPTTWEGVLDEIEARMEEEGQSGAEKA